MHAFFKALLFLSAGAVIHALAGEQSLNKMGGLRRHLGWPTLGFLVGAFALGGIAPFSGFFSKDEILEQATELGTLGISLAVVGTVGSVMTAFYAFRAYFRAFEGPDREGGYGHLHRTNWRMVVPIAVLSVGATFAGWLQVPSGWHLIDDWLESAFLAAPDVKASVTSEVVISLCTFVFGLAAIGLAWWMFGRGPEWRLRHANVAPGVRRVVEDQYMLNEVYDEVFVKSGQDLGDAMVRYVEPGGVFHSIRTTTSIFLASASSLRWAQSGLVRSYVFVFVVGAVVIGAVVIIASQI
jgi:NADH-quinone oxidoreductase subunit L